MPHPFLRRLSAAALGALAFAPGLVAAAGASEAVNEAAPIGIIVDGRPLALARPPVERVGRVYVPMRAVFERLGASVVYADGTINATAGAHTIALCVGSSVAIVDRRELTLETPLFKVDGAVLIPLRFVSQALGAAVAYRGDDRVVVVSTARPPVASPAPVRPAPAPTSAAPMRLLRLAPADGERLETDRPELAGTFSRRVDPDALELTLDGRNVAKAAYVSERGFAFDPAYVVPYGPHEARVQGVDREGRRFDRSWRFLTVAPAAAQTLRVLSPRNGERVGEGVVIEGLTRPRSVVRITATTSVASGGDAVDAVVRTQTRADAAGRFSARIRVGAPVDVVDVELRATAPDGGVAERSLRLLP